MSNTFLKWAGGKKWFITGYNSFLPTNYNRYIEPFLGGGSVFFYMQSVQPHESILSDVNEELINTYIAVRDQVDSVYYNLRIHARNHSRDYYYRIRNRNTRTLATSAARMIYLNKTCFNGIYRVNSQGRFNVPFGTREQISFDRQLLVQSSLDLTNASLLCQDFEQTIDMAEDGDFLFCDPPYAVINEDDRFVGYTADIFSWKDQIRLANALSRARQRGVKIVMTNVEHPTVRRLYEEREGFCLDTITRKCIISGNTKGRKSYKELIVRANIE